MSFGRFCFLLVFQAVLWLAVPVAFAQTTSPPKAGAERKWLELMPAKRSAPRQMMGPSATAAAENRAYLGCWLAPATAVPRCLAAEAQVKRAAPPSALILPILMYHHVRELPPNASSVWRGLTVTPAAFRQQLAYLVEHNYHTISFARLAAYVQYGARLPQNPIILTFDDGWREDFDTIYPMLRETGLSGTFFPPTNWLDHSPLTLTWDQIEEMSRGGMEFGSHTLNHHFLTTQASDAVSHQLTASMKLLSDHVSRPVLALAYPGGAFNAATADLAKEAGFFAAVTIQPGVNVGVTDLFRLRRIVIAYGDDLKIFARKLAPPPVGKKK